MLCSFFADSETHDGHGASLYAWPYGAFGALFLITQLLRTGTFYWWALSAANRMFRRQLHRVLHTPMAFLLFKPVGELLTAFTSDQDRVDEALPDAVHLAGVTFVGCCCSFGFFFVNFCYLDTCVVVCVHERAKPLCCCVCACHAAAHRAQHLPVY